MAEASQMAITGGKRKLVALAGLAILAALAWYTMDAGKARILVMILLGGFAFRITLASRHSRYDEAEPPEQTLEEGEWRSERLIARAKPEGGSGLPRSPGRRTLM